MSLDLGRACQRGYIGTADNRGYEMLRFTSLAEIEDLQGFVDGEPIDLESYGSLIGYYHLDKEELRCCVMKQSGTLCQTPHRRGWVAKKKSGALTVIGGDCAKDKFAADSSIMRDIAAATKALDEEELRARFAELLSVRDVALSEVTAAHVELDDRRRKVKALLDGFGPANRQRLEELARTDGVVRVQGFTPEKLDEEGEVIQDGVNIRITIGKIVGVRVCTPSVIPTCTESLRETKRVLESANESALSGHSSLLKKLNAAIADYPRIVRSATDLIAEIDQFLGADLTPACFLVSDWRSRIAVATEALRRQASKEDPKHWLRKLDGNLRNRHHVEQIRIGAAA